MQDAILRRAKKFRHQMHSSPELSANEQKTNLAILNYLKDLYPDEIIPNIGGFGIAGIYKGTQPGKRILLRCDIDALPIQEEKSDKDYSSINDGVAHLCGHDGHTASILALAEILSKKKPEKGEVVLLFQPAEETGQGAKNVSEDPKFNRIKPDMAFGLHNLPGFELGNIVINNEGQSFASASTGLAFKLFGKTSHAAEPESGISPAIPVAKMILELSKLSEGFDFFTLLTIIHVKIGEIAFGTSPGYGEVMMTLRAHTDEHLKELLGATLGHIKEILANTELNAKSQLVEPFPATVNDKQLRERFLVLLRDDHIDYLDAPFKWSEDFGHFSNICPSLYFGIGAGKQSPALHNPEYDYPDQLIERTATILHKIVREFT